MRDPCRHRGRALGLLVGFAADGVLGDPAVGHPVALFGRFAARVERRWYADRRSIGAGYALTLVAAATLTGCVLQRAGRAHPALRAAGTGLITWVTLGGTSLARQGARMATDLQAGDLVRARQRLPSLCGRDPAMLDAPGLTRASIESVAENTSDAVVAPLLWGALAGVPGMVAYRAANTLDAMVGYRDPRYHRFGWAAARLDDAANLAPARLAAALTVLCAPVVEGSPGRARRAWRRDAAAHPSPNAGQVESAFAGALDVRLGGATPYAHGTEQRPPLGSDRTPNPCDLRRAVRLSRAVTAVAGLLAVAAGLSGG